MSQEESGIVLSTLSNAQCATYKRKVTHEVKMFIVSLSTSIPESKDVVTWCEASKLNMEKVSAEIKQLATKYVDKVGAAALATIADASEVKWMDMDKATKWLRNVVSRSLRQHWLSGAFKYFNDCVCEGMHTKPLHISDDKIVYAHIEDSVNEALDMLVVEDVDVDEEEGEDSDSQSDSSDLSSSNDDESSMSESGSDVDIDTEELKAEAKSIDSRRKKRKRAHDDEEQED